MIVSGSWVYISFEKARSLRPIVLWNSSHNIWSHRGGLCILWVVYLGVSYHVETRRPDEATRRTKPEPKMLRPIRWRLVASSIKRGRMWCDQAWTRHASVTWSAKPCHFPWQGRISLGTRLVRLTNMDATWKWDTTLWCHEARNLRW